MNDQQLHDHIGGVGAEEHRLLDKARVVESYVQWRVSYDEQLTSICAAQSGGAAA